MIRWKMWTARVGALLMLGIVGADALAQAPVAPAARVKRVKRVKAAKKAGATGHHVAAALLPIEFMDSLLTLTADQKTKIAAIQTKLKVDVEASRTKIGTQTAAAPPPTKIGGMARELALKADGDIRAVLTSDQNAKLNDALPMLQMLAQSRVAPMRKLASANLTSAQLGQLESLAAQEQDKIKMAGKGVARKTAHTEAVADFKTKADAILTPEQKAAIANARPERGTARRKNRKAKSANGVATSANGVAASATGK